MWKLFRDFCLILLCFTGKYVQCFNFDTNFPIVYVDPHNFSGYPLEKTSYFGYSVLLYEGGPNNNPWIQVGAPRGRNPNWGNELTGVVYRCGVKSTCYHVNLIPAADDSYAGEAYFGNSMDISNDKNIYAVCGHRWIENKTSDYYMEGACFGGKTTENGTTFYKPLHKQLGQLTSISGVRVYNTAQAQLGFSAQFSQSKENELLVGLPGLLNWKGSAGLLSKAVPPEAARRRRRRSTDELESAFIPEMVTVDDVKFFDLAGKCFAANYK
ncbi:hypothetical protein QE152_g33732 [Popillia japonica]|uniref:Uncharacterized protein n=1 Tax=Popillia japonica TaxID=7064 RepID=A0AAW1IV97_POPJA